MIHTKVTRWCVNVMRGWFEWYEQSAASFHRDNAGFCFAVPFVVGMTTPTLSTEVEASKTMFHKRQGSATVCEYCTSPLVPGFHLKCFKSTQFNNQRKVEILHPSALAEILLGPVSQLKTHRHKPEILWGPVRRNQSHSRRETVAISCVCV